MGKRDSSDLKHGTKQQHPGPDVWGGAVGDSISMLCVENEVMPPPGQFG